MRYGDPRMEIEGWGIDGFDDLIALRASLRRQGKADPQHAIAYLSPVSPSWTQAQSYFDNPPTRPSALRRHRATNARKQVFLDMISNGLTIPEACRSSGTTQAVFESWRQRDLDFLAAYHQARVASSPVDHWDGTFASFRRYYFGYESYTHHLAIIDAIETTPPGGVTMILLPPSAGKTSLLEDYLCSRIAQDPNYRILYVTETADGHARKVLSTVKDRMTDPEYADPNAPGARIPEYMARFGPFHDPVEDTDKPWNQNYIKVHKSSGRRDYSLQCSGWRSRIYGARCDLLVFDDVQSEESLGVTEKMLRSIRKTFFSRPGKDGQTIFIGTRIGPGDVYERLIEEGVVDRLVQLPALDEHGNSYCPPMWSEDDLAKKRLMVGEDVWWSAYMQQPQLAQDATFTDELLDAAKDQDVFACRRPDMVSEGADSDSWKIIAGLDPALGGGNALTIVACNNTKFRFIDQFIDYGLLRNEDIFNRIKEATRYHFTELIVERNSQQRGLARDDRLREIAQRFGFRITEHETGNNKYDFNFGVSAMAGSFVRREVVIPWGDEFSQKRMGPLIGELRSYRPGLTPKLQRQDMVMSTWFCWLWWQRQKTYLRTDQEQWKSAGTPWKPGDMSGRWNGRKVAS